MTKVEVTCDEFMSIKGTGTFNVLPTWLVLAMIKHMSRCSRCAEEVAETCARVSMAGYTREEREPHVMAKWEQLILDGAGPELARIEKEATEAP